MTNTDRFPKSGEKQRKKKSAQGRSSEPLFYKNVKANSLCVMLILIFTWKLKVSKVISQIISSKKNHGSNLRYKEKGQLLVRKCHKMANIG